jgi:GAF domain-containing protein
MGERDQSGLLRHEVRALFAIARAMNTTLSRQAMLEAVLQAVVTELGYKAASLRLLDAEQRTLNLQAAYGLSQAYLDKGRVELERNLVDREALQGKPVVIRDVATASGVQYPQAALQEGIRSVLSVPLHTALGEAERIIGVMRVYTARQHDFAQDEIEFLGAVANLAARALTYAHLYEAFQAIAQQVNSSLKVQEVLTALLRSTVRELNFKAASIRLLGPRKKRLHIAAAEGLSPQYLNKGEVRIEDSPVDREVMQGRSVTIFDVAHEPGFQYPAEAEREGIRSVLAVPLSVHGEIVGVLRIYSGQPHRFTAEEEAFVRAVADLGAIALENARLHEALERKYEAAREDWSGWYRFLALS